MTNNGKPTITRGAATLEPAAPELDRQTLDQAGKEGEEGLTLLERFAEVYHVKDKAWMVIQEARRRGELTDTQSLEREILAGGKTPSDRVLGRVMALCHAEGYVFRTMAEEESMDPKLSPTGSSRAASYDPESSAAGKALEMVWSYAMQQILTHWDESAPASYHRDRAVEEQAQAFTISLLANLYADEARRLVP